MPILESIGLGLQAGTTVYNAFSQGRTNRENRAFAVDMYNRQRNEALADAAFQNHYNSPAEQMKRYKAAGLNPNLIYGTTNSNVPAVQMRSSDAPQGQSKAPQLNAPSLLDYQNIKLQQAQTENVKANTQVALQEARNKALEADRIVADTKMKGSSTGYLDYKTGLGNSTFGTSVEAAKANLELTNTRNRQINNAIDVANQQLGLQIQANERQELLNASNIKEAAIRMLNIKQQTLESKSRTTFNNAQYQTELQKCKKLIQDIENGVHDGELKVSQIYSNIQNADKHTVGQVIGKNLNQATDFVKKHIGSIEPKVWQRY